MPFLRFDPSQRERPRSRSASIFFLDFLAAMAFVSFWQILLQKSENCNGLNFWRELEARRDR
jgi:hypothetical protein